MQKSLMTHRRCLVCKEETTDLSQERCSCGAYMYMISQIYTPKVNFDKTQMSAKKITAPSTLAGTVLLANNKGETPRLLAL